jgi:toxin secretion/phage lysis holin
MKTENIYTGSKAGIAAIGAFLSERLGILYPVLMLLTVLMIADFISGMAASKKESLEHPEDKSKGWSSKRGVQGIFKKIGYALAIAVAMSVDWLIFNVTGNMGIKIPTSTFFGLLTVIWFIINELLSILENAGRLGTPLPDFLKKAIAVLKTGVEKQGNAIVDKGDKIHENN